MDGFSKYERLSRTSYGLRKIPRELQQSQKQKSFWSCGIKRQK